MKAPELLCVICGEDDGSKISADKQKGSTLLKNYVKCLDQHFQESNFGGNEDTICDSCSFILSSVINDLKRMEGVRKEVTQLEKPLHDKLGELKTAGQRVVVCGLDQIAELINDRIKHSKLQNENWLLNLTEKAAERIWDETGNLEEQQSILKKSISDVNQFRTNGGTPILSKEEEEILKTTVGYLQNQGVTVSSTDIKRICFEYCVSKGVPNQFDQDTRMASEDWYCGFLKRHPDIKISRPGRGKGSREALLDKNGMDEANMEQELKEIKSVNDGQMADGSDEEEDEAKAGCFVAGAKCNVNQFQTDGGTPTLSKEEEEILETTIKDLQKQGFFVSSKDIKRICFEYCEENEIANQFDKEKRIASDDWYCGFLKRHPDVKISRPTKRNRSGEALLAGAKVTFSASGDVTALGDGTIAINTAPTKVSRPSDNPNPKQPDPISLKSCLKKPKKRSAGTDEETYHESDSKRAKKGIESSISVLGVKNYEDAEMERVLALLEIEDDNQVAETSDEEKKNEDDDKDEAEAGGVFMDKQQLEGPDVANGEGEISKISEGEEKDGIGGVEESDKDESSSKVMSKTCDDNGKPKERNVPSKGTGECPSSAEDNDESRKEAIEKARKWYEDYMGNKNRKLQNRKNNAGNPNLVGFECPICLRMYQYESKLVAHISACADLRLFKCRAYRCDKTFRNSSQARLHYHYQRCHLKTRVE